MKKHIAPIVLSLLMMGCAPQREPFFVGANDFYADTGVVHTVVRGDSVHTIAERYKVDVDYIIYANAIPKGERLYIGQQLRIPNEYQHKIEGNDTLTGIAHLYGVRVLDLAQHNDMQVSDSPALGKIINIPAMRVPREEPVKPIDLSVLLDQIIADGGQIVAIPPSAVAELKSKPIQPTAPMKITGQTTGQVTKIAPLAKVTVEKTKTIKVPEFSGFAWPVEGKIVHKYGSMINGIKNSGINIEASAGTGISAAEGGRVAYAGEGVKGMGKMILIRHDQGYITVYAHAEDILVKKGQILEKGDLIATVGDTGSVETAQLHFQVRKGKTPIDPKTVLG